MLAQRLALRATRSATRSAFRAAPVGIRFLSTPAPEPKAKATSLIDSLPGNSPLTKTGILATTAAGAIYAISNELYVVNDESILLTTFTGFVLLVVKVVAPLYNDWASGTIKNITDVLNSSRTKHVDAVKERIDQVSELKDVVATTKALFEISKETAALEAEAFELKQQVEIAHEAKSVLDSWVRYESQVRQLEQQQLATSVIAKVQAEIGNPKFQEKLLAQSVEEIEALFAKEK